MDERRSFIRMDGRTTLFYMDGWMDGRRCFTMDGRRCFIRMGGRTTLFYQDGWTDDVVL